MYVEGLLTHFLTLLGQQPSPSHPLETSGRFGLGIKSWVNNPPPHPLRVSGRCLKEKQKQWSHKHPCFGLLVTSALGFEARMDSWRACMLSCPHTIPINVENLGKNIGHCK